MENFSGLIFLLFFGCFLSCQTAASEEDNQDVTEIIESPVKDTIAFPSYFSLGYLTGQFDPGKDSAFVLIESKYASRGGMFLRKEAYAAFIKMAEKAKEEGINLKILSATRNFNAQKSIWEAKWTGQRRVGGKNLSESLPDPTERALKILEYSSMPGTSRHHWGTDIDINSLNNPYFEQGEGLKVYNWLTLHAPDFGFCQTYTKKGPERPDGYNEEKWHWSYLPVAELLTKYAAMNLKNEKISGFLGAETASSINVVKNYILGINKSCYQQN